MENGVSNFSAELASLQAMLAWVRSKLETTVFTDQDARYIEIALEEALVNIIRYAYKDQKGVIEITYNYWPSDRLEIILKDSGSPFNPLKIKNRLNRSAPLEKRKVGGLGIPLMQSLMDQIEYLRKGGSNVLTLKKWCPKTSSP